jgi:uncharacterized protein (TIGR02001 family)
MKQSRLYLATALLAFAGAAQAELTVTPAVVSDYDFRGISQTAKSPALQLGVNYATESGLYVGAWGSNLDFGSGDPKVEVDLNVGFAGGDAAESFGYDAGVVYYTYSGASDFNFPEAYVGLSRGWFAGKLWYSTDFGGVGESAYYVEGNGSFPLAQDFTLLAHVGYSGGNYWDAAYGKGYTDWSVGVSRNFGKVAVSLKFVDGSNLPDGNSKIFSTDSKVVATISTTLPWSAD